MLEAVRKSVLLLLLGVTFAGCSAGRANVIEDHPTLVVPPVPPRAIEPPPPNDLPAVAPVVEVPAPPVTPASKPTNRSAANRSEPKPDPKPEQPPPETVPPPPPNPNTVAPLRSATTPSGPEAERQIKEIMDRTGTTLNTRVDYQKLSDDGKATYDAAKAFIEQAGAALKKGDLALAKSFAERAENMAKQLQGR